MNADNGGAALPLAESVHKLRRNAWLAMDGVFKLDADRSFDDFAEAATLEIKAAIGDDEDNVVPFRAAKDD